MDELWRNQVPAFGSWDCNDDGLPFTQCFESARQPGAGLFPYAYTQDRDLYLAAGDLYQNHVVTPTMLVVPRRKGKKHVKVGKKEDSDWVVCDYDYHCECEDYKVKVKEPPSPPPPPPPKAVDEDLYKISPELLYAKSNKKRGWGFFSSCLVPNCGN